MPDAPRHRPNLDNPVLRTRPPTKKVPAPFLLVEGEEGAGKTWLAALLTKSQRVGRCFWLDLGEGGADEYAAIEGTRYEVLEHDGTYAAVLEQVLAVRALAQEAQAKGEPPVVIIIDTMSNVWEGLKDWVSLRAREKPANKKKLAEDPAAELDVSRNLWNDAGNRYRRLMNALLTFPGIVVATAKGKQISATDPATGQPFRDGRKTWTVEGEKNLAHDATMVLRMRREEPPQITKARSVHASVKPGTDKPVTLIGDREPPHENVLEWLIFDVLRFDPQDTHARDYKPMTGGDLLPEEREDEQKEQQQSAPTPQQFRAILDDITARGRGGDPRGALTALGKLVGTHGEATLAKVGPMRLANGREVTALEGAQLLRDFLGTLPQKPEEGTADEAALTDTRERPPADAPSGAPSDDPNPSDSPVVAAAQQALDEGADARGVIGAAQEAAAGDDAAQQVFGEPGPSEQPLPEQPKESPRPRGTEDLKPAPSNPVIADWLDEVEVQAEARGITVQEHVVDFMANRKEDRLPDVPKAILKGWVVSVGRPQALLAFRQAGMVDEADRLERCPANSAATRAYVTQE